MSLSEICIRRPVFSTVICLILIIVGIVSFSYLEVRQYPQIDRPVISVITSYEGASPEIMETQITKPLEGALAGVEGLDYITSKSEPENSVIKLFFKPDRDLDGAAADVRDRIGRIRDRLPHDAPQPIIQKSDADAEPVIYLALTSDTVTIPELYKFADKRLKDQIQAVSGVSNVEVQGSSPLVMHLWLDPVKMAGYQITVQDVDEALKRQNVEIPAGRMISQDREYNVTTSALLHNPLEYDQLIIREVGGHIVRLKDIGSAEFGPSEPRSAVFFNGQRAVAIEVVKKSTANPLKLVDALKKELPKLRQGLPTGAELSVAFDTSVYITESINQVYKTLIEAVILVIVVVWVFLWSARGAVIPLVTIPVSLISTFALMYIFGYTINVLTLLALVLAIGLVVDDAIVMLENIYRYIEGGYAPFEASIKGAKEITFSIIAMTVTLAAVYAPIALSEGSTGKLFTEFAVSLAGAVMISGLIALTLTPTMCSRMLQSHAANATHARVLAAIDRGYERLLVVGVKGRWLMLGASITVALLGGYIAKNVLKSELAPREDQGILFGVVDGEQGTTLSFMEKYVNQLDEILRVPEVANQLSVITIPTAMTYNVLVPWRERQRSANQIKEDLKHKVWDIPGVSAGISPGGSPFGSGGAADKFSFVLQTTRSYNELLDMAALIVRAMFQKGGFERIDEDISPETQEFYMDIDRDKLATMGIDVETLGRTLDSLISGRRVTKFRYDGEQFDVRAQLIGDQRADPNDLNHIFLRASSGKEVAMVPLINVVDIKRRTVPTVINHYNQLKSITIRADLTEALPLSDAVVFLDQIRERLLTDDYRVEFAGSTKKYLENQYTIYLIFGLALCFIYLVMAAQFESFIDPFIIMFSVPLSLTGALITLWLTGGSLNIFSQIGLVTLIGLITKHGILIVDFSNKLRQKGLPVAEAVVKAAKLRLRPVLMTTFAMVLGAVPLALASGAGAAGLNQIGWVIVGGMCFGTLLTLFIVPAVYTILTPKVDRRITLLGGGG